MITLDTKERLGLIGLGLMGRPMALNLLRAGYPLTVYNRSPEPVAALVEAGAHAAATPRAVAEVSAIVLTCLPDSPDVRDILTRADGVLAADRPGLLIIDMSTIAPAAAVDLAQVAAAQGARFLDAPVSGGDVGAREATLTIMVGGDAADLERARPVLAALGRRITHCGPHGSGQIVKACNQVVVTLAYSALSEALVLGAAAGVDPAIVLSVLSGGLAQSRIMDLRGPTMAQHAFAPGGRTRFHRKDLGIVLNTARAHGVALPLTALADQLYTALAAQGGGDLDPSAILTVLEGLSATSIA